MREPEPLPELLTRADVADLLEVPLKTLTWWVWAWRKHRRYVQFEIARGNGETRLIQAPIKPIKDMQRRLADVLTSAYEPPPYVHGFVPHRSPVSNARVHRRQQWLLRLDIKDFFPSIHFGRVRGMFMKYPFEYPPEVATLLAQLCCHNNELPQGAPTSPIITNYICRRLDTALGRLAKTERCYYSRYADDLCFSTDRTVFPAHLATVTDGASEAGSAITEIIKDNGFTLNPEKARLMRRTQRQRITGLVVNEQVNLPREYVRHLRGLLYIWQRHGEAEAAAALLRAEGPRNWPSEKARPSLRLVVRGRVQHVGRIKGWENPIYMSLASSLHDIDPSFVRAAATSDKSLRAVVFTEGESDALHLRAAHHFLRRRGLFTDLNVDYQDVGDKGEDALLRQCQAQARTRQRQPCVFVFDRDTQSMVKKVDGPQGWRNWGNGVVSVPLIAPSWREGEDVCIELLYEDEVFERHDADGRRLFQAREFDRHSGLHNSGEYTTPHPGHKTLIRENVFSVASNSSVGLSKMAFATALSSAGSGFEGVSFEGFEGTFAAIRGAVMEADDELVRGT